MMAPLTAVVDHSGIEPSGARVGKCAAPCKSWLSGLESKPDKLLKRELCYRYTTGQAAAQYGARIQGAKKKLSLELGFPWSFRAGTFRCTGDYNCRFNVKPQCRTIESLRRSYRIAPTLLYPCTCLAVGHRTALRSAPL